jgi:peptide methionine sulfoxide reductase MsrA
MKATFGLGCFWCSEDVFMKVKGVKSTAVGYMGGWLENPAYKDVSALTRMVMLESYNLNTIHL